MLYAIIIQIGATIYNFDHLSYKDLETCEYHREKIYDNFHTKKWQGHGSMKVRCQRLSNNGKSSSTSWTYN